MPHVSYALIFLFFICRSYLYLPEYNQRSDAISSLGELSPMVGPAQMRHSKGRSRHFHLVPVEHALAPEQA